MRIKESANKLIGIIFTPYNYLIARKSSNAVDQYLVKAVLVLFGTMAGLGIANRGFNVGRLFGVCLIFFGAVAMLVGYLTTLEVLFRQDKPENRSEVVALGALCGIDILFSVIIGSFAGVGLAGLCFFIAGCSLFYNWYKIHSLSSKRVRWVNSIVGIALGLICTLALFDLCFGPLAPGRQESKCPKQDVD